ncbi:acetyltransferase [Streptomyces sp. PTM05]|uniref:Lysine N-acyltransferase MbtK n=1 Tax=Streptantibioticus parmotrematis TaxID=2873249 RepID=A0ABS7QZH6_9ACTN|nr:GNAT family N-acetyltransferase [Streptantibioticus parmotrematis]MBY8887177.1 acetyltransferase [Streptantibioticus parmotrematis]
MPPTDARTEDRGTESGEPGARTDAGGGARTASGDEAGAGEPAVARTGAGGCEDTLDLDLHAPVPLPSVPVPSAAAPPGPPGPGGDDPLDGLAGWGPVATPLGAFHLVPVEVERDLTLLTGWMNDPAVAEYWHLAGPPRTTEEHLRAQLDGDGRSVPCLGVLDGTPMSYWEVYRADLDPLARYYPARPHDTGLHVLIGRIADRGRGTGAALLRAVADHVLDRRPACARVIAEPDLRNTASVAAFLAGGFRFALETDLPDKRAALMIRERALRDRL